MGMAAIMFMGGEPFKELVSILSTEGPMWNLLKIDQAVSEKKTYKNYAILNMYIAQGQWQINPRRKKMIITLLLL